MSDTTVQRHSIRLKADGKMIHDLEIDEVKEGLRDRSVFPKDLRGAGMGVLVDDGGIHFRTLETRKRFFLPFTAFSFALRWQE